MKTISIRKVLNDILNEQEESKMIDELLKLGNRLKALKPKNDGTVSNNQKRVITKMKNEMEYGNNGIIEAFLNGQEIIKTEKRMEYIEIG